MNWTMEDVIAMKDELLAEGLIEEFEQDGETYVRLTDAGRAEVLGHLNQEDK